MGRIVTTTPRIPFGRSSNKSLSTSFQPIEFREAGFSNETLQHSCSAVSSWAAHKIEQSFGRRGFCLAGRAFSVSTLSPAVVCSVTKLMTVADGDTLALIMPVRAECCSTPGPACASSASLVPPAPINTHQPGVATSLLYSGSQFRGYQKSKGNSYDVEVVLQVIEEHSSCSGVIVSLINVVV